jgi:hypothetical protein
LDEDFKRFSTIYEALLNEWEKLADEVPVAKEAYETEYAKQIKTADGTVAMKEAEAAIRTSVPRLALLKAEARLEFIKAKVRWADKELSILQTRAANERSQMQLSSLPNQKW